MKLSFTLVESCSSILHFGIIFHLHITFEHQIIKKLRLPREKFAEDRDH